MKNSLVITMVLDGKTTVVRNNRAAALIIMFGLTSPIWIPVLLIRAVGRVLRRLIK